MNQLYYGDNLSALNDAGRAASSAAMAVAAARFRARLAGQADPAGERTARVLAGYPATIAAWALRMMAHYSAGATAERGAVARSE